MDNVIPVNTIGELFTEEFNAQKNLINLPRTLHGDFNALAREIWTAKWDEDGVLSVDNLDDFMLDVPPLSLPAQKALQSLWQDIDKLKMINLQTEVRLLESDNELYWNDHTYDFHADTIRNVDMGRVVCCYTGAATEWLRPQDARPIGDSSYQALPDAQIFALPLHHMWRQACIGVRPENKNPPNGAQPLAHRAPKDSDLRLMLLASKLA